MRKNQDQKIEELLNRGVAEVLPNRQELKNLMKKRKIKLYFGIDPTSSRLHLGHTIGLRKLKKFADLGHETILVVGTGTVLAGDPSLRETSRPLITQKEIRKNIKTWKNQAASVLDFSKVKIKYNGDWLLKLNYRDINEIGSHLSAAELFQREMFQRRLKKGDTVWVKEFLYPLFQGYDSVALNVDLEIGGTDQTFNMLIGRKLLQKMRKKEKFVMTLKMILGTDGQPMSKTRGNCVWLTDSSDEMYGKIMSIPDSLVFDYSQLLTDLSLQKMKNLLPQEAKSSLAREIVSMYCGKKAAGDAEKEFNRIFKEKQLPSRMPQIRIKEESLNILDFLVKIKLASSKAAAKRLVEQGGVKIDGQTKKDWREKIEIKKNQIVQVGKRKFAKII